MLTLAPSMVVTPHLPVGIGSFHELGAFTAIGFKKQPWHMVVEHMEDPLTSKLDLWVHIDSIKHHHDTPW